jgi:hypothetical protein
MSQIKDSSNNIVSEKKDSANTIKDTAKNSDNHFDQNTLILIIGFLAVYFIIHFVLGFFYNKEDPYYHSLKSRMVDVVVIGLIGAYAAYYYFSMNQKDKDEFLPQFIAGTKAYLNNAYSILEVSLFLLLFYIGAFILGIPMSSEDKPFSIQFFESNAIIFLIILLIIQFFKYYLKVPVVDIIFGDFSSLSKFGGGGDSTSDATSTTGAAAANASNTVKKEEAFNISNNLYSYTDAKSVCSALGSRLATYDEIEDAYNNGAEWSSYGWSEGQHAYFPTQKSTWQKLQQVKGHEHDLGRPGVNGGYFSNPNVRFGVNCYGVKPPITDAEKAMMDSKRNQIYPKTAEDALVDTKVEFWKKNKDKLMVVSGFNNNNWSRF